MDLSALPPPPPLADFGDGTPPALFLDFDGTLIEIAAGPEDISVPRDLADRLMRLDKALDGRLALVSGRGLDNIEAHIGPLAIARAGSHGAEPVDAAGQALGTAPQPLSDETLGSLRQISAQYGALMERKRHGAALHYRGCPQHGPAIIGAAQSIADDTGLAAKSGKCVIELVRPGADKGAAVRLFMQTPAFAGSMPIFIGDDVTDEDGFIAARDAGGCGIAVGDRLSDNAKYRLQNVKDVHQWLNL